MSGTEVMVTRHRDALEGQRLTVLGRSCRSGRAELLVLLPDGSKRVIPEAWTDQASGRGGGGARIARRPACTVLACLAAFGPLRR